MQCWIAVTPTTDADLAARALPTAYTYETDDRSKKQIAANDLLFLRDQKRLLAVAHVESVTTEKREQTVATCPVCSGTKIEMRKKRDIPYRCFHGHQFTDPTEEQQMTVVHTAFFPHDFVRITAQIEPAELRPFELTNSRHVKLKLGDITGICGYVARRDHNVGPILKSWLRNRTLTLGDREAEITGAALGVVDEPDRPLQAIRARRGLASFRDKLITRYGAKCMISGCNVLALLEACHVSRYQRPEDNHPANGVLLRSDLHTLFDLDLIGLNPVDMQVRIHSDLIGTEYEKFARQRLQFSSGYTLDMRAVRARWEQFISKTSQVLQKVSVAAIGMNILLSQMS